VAGSPREVSTTMEGASIKTREEEKLEGALVEKTKLISGRISGVVQNERQIEGSVTPTQGKCSTVQHNTG